MMITICLLLASTILVAQSRNQTTGNSGVSTGSVSTCFAAPTLMPDGTTPGYEDFVAASGVGYYWQYFESGHSYSVDAWDPFDSTNGHVQSLSLLLADGTCSHSLGYQDVKGVTPNLSGANADRISWVQPTAGTAMVFLVNLDQVDSYNYYIQ